jgi:hypothetical protein
MMNEKSLIFRFNFNATPTGINLKSKHKINFFLMV